MDCFLEANRIVEVSLTKLKTVHKTGDIPLRKTLLISKVLNIAQEVATSAHLSFITSPPSTRTRSSKLLASISQESEHLTNDESRVGPTRTIKPWRQTSPIASAALGLQQDLIQVAEESMDFMSVSSVLSNVFCDNETKSKELIARSLLSSDSKKNTKRSKPFENLTNHSWSAWQFDMDTDLGWDSETPKSPGKRLHKDAFPSTEKENSLLWPSVSPEEPKRFKPSTPEGCPLESLPGYCGYLSPKNLQSAPLLTYMFGNAFTSDSSKGWPQSDSDFEQCDHHFNTSSSPILAY